MDAGEQVTPTLRLVRPLGRGAGGEVWVAEHGTLGKLVALKILAMSGSARTTRLGRFKREAASATLLGSPYVATLLDHGVTTAGAPFIVNELLEGETLRARLDRGGRLPPAEVARLVGQAARGLAHAHKLGIVHRDVRPETLFLVEKSGDASLKILGFGVEARELQDDAPRPSARGESPRAPLYMSPEYFLGARDIDLRADLWSLAVVAYEALTGEVPFDGSSMGALALALHCGTFVPPGRRLDTLPPALDAWMARALSHDPEARFSSAPDMALALTEALTMQAPPTPQAKPATIPPRPSYAERFATRTWAVATIATTLLTVGSLTVLALHPEIALGSRGAPRMVAQPIAIMLSPQEEDAPTSPSSVTTSAHTTSAHTTSAHAAGAYATGANTTAAKASASTKSRSRRGQAAPTPLASTATPAAAPQRRGGSGGARPTPSPRPR
ncbi:serine/threonine-protein kinase [Chondromyces apiculatus]|uniref:Protein kinase domain-containing protein n=1 Tax=Chondromyces apiculatus DSM 436 TaxID=1192034 RepID=A0A017T486_9BACT|nr:serine/threonine-protein kinase [Chondromyces apiculatus]EYF03396.1 Hypothetical protein CAP_5589 [Chondromyces apiculatus DSM 436]